MEVVVDGSNHLLGIEHWVYDNAVCCFNKRLTHLFFVNFANLSRGVDHIDAIGELDDVCQKTLGKNLILIGIDEVVVLS